MLKRRNISAQELLNSLNEELSVENAVVEDHFDLWSEDIIHTTISFTNCVFYDLVFAPNMFDKLVIFRNCEFFKADFFATYFLGGLIIDQCTFQNDLYLMTDGGHNKPDKPIRIMNTTFDGFVDVSGAWFEGPFIITNCLFNKGTNLLGNVGQPYQIQFDFKPQLNDNIGEMDIDK